MNTAGVDQKLIRAIVDVCATALYLRDDLRGYLIDAGVTAQAYDVHDLPDKPKAKIARDLLAELRLEGPDGEAKIRRLVVELCQMDEPAYGADPEAGKAALERLRKVAAESRVVIDVASHERQRDAQAAAEQRAHADRLNQLRETFTQLSRPKLTPAEVQRRGYDLETFVADLMAAYGIEHTRQYRAPHERIDGSFKFGAFTYLTEYKWTAMPTKVEDLFTFRAKVDGKMDSVRGLFLSMAGFQENTLDHFLRVPRGLRNNMILMDGHDLMLIVEERISLPDALRHKIDAAELRGEQYQRLGT